MADVLPSSLPRISRGAVERNGSWWIPMFCLNCGCEGPCITEQQKGYATAWLCIPCAPKWAPIMGQTLTSDDVFYARVAQAQIDAKGRPFTHEEMAAALDDATSPLSLLAKEGPR